MKVARVARDNDPTWKASKAWQHHFEAEGIVDESYGPYRKESPIERAMKTIGHAARASMEYGNAPETEFFDAISHAVFCYNRRPHTTNPKWRSPMSAWHGVKLKPSTRMLRGVLFCLVYATIYSEERGKNDNQAFPAVYHGCSHDERTFRARCLASGKKYWVSDGKFVESIMPYRQTIPGQLSSMDADTSETCPDAAPPLASKEHMQRIREPSAQGLESIASHTVKSTADVTTWAQAMASEEREHWIDARRVENDNHKINGTWVLVDRSEAKGHKIFFPKYVLKKKMLPPDLEYPMGRVDKYKVRKTIAAYKHMLRDGVDYREKYAATPRWISYLVMFAIAAFFDLEISLSDVVAFFLTSFLEKGEKIFMEQDEDDNDGTDRVCELKKSCYGLPQAAYHSQQKLIKNFEEDSIMPSVGD